MRSTTSRTSRHLATTRRRITVGRLAAIVTALAVAATALVAGVTVAEPANAVVQAGTIPAGTSLRPGDVLTSPNGQYRLVMQGDGNLVEYGIGNRVLWSSGTSNQPGASALVRADGMLVLSRNGVKVKWWGKSGYTASGLSMTADGNVSMLDTAGTARWGLGTFQDRMTAGTVLLPGSWLRPDSTTSRSIRMMSSGELIQAENGRVTWRSGTAGHPGAYAAVQADGNLVVYTPDRTPLWATNTSRAGAGQLLIQVDGNVVLYGKAGTRVWSTRKVTGLAWPVVSHTITGRFGDDRGPGHTPRYHQGADAGVPVGTPVYASGTGTVTTATSSASYGNYVVVTYGLTTVLTAHMSSISVTPGQTVSRDTLLGKSGNTGQSTGPHVHVELRVNGTLQDPLTVLQWR